MKQLNPSFDLESFFSTLSSAKQSLLMLDYDGTLAPFTPQRDQAFIYPELQSVLSDLSAAPRTRLVLVSGRALAELKQLAQIYPPPEMWGSHGGEMIDAKGRYRCLSQTEKPAEGLAKVYWWARENNFLEQTERKPTGIAFHWRGLEEESKQRMEQAVRVHWVERLAPFELELHDFDGGLECRVSGISKAGTVRMLLDQIGPETPCAYLGDDLTDEDAFEALGTHGLKLLVRPEFRETGADFWLQPPDELLEFLERWLRSCSGH